MSFRPWSGVMPKLDAVMQLGNGVEASLIGQQYNVYRVTSASNGSIIGGAPLYANFPLALQQKAKKVQVENTTFDLVVFEGTCDNTLLQKDDVLVEYGYKNDGGAWIFAQGRPTHESIFVRAETTGFVSRPYTASGSVAQQPGPNDPDVIVRTQQAGTRIAIEKYLTLVNGSFKFDVDADIGASIPFGIQLLNRVTDSTEPKLPTGQYRTRALIYCPNIPGETIAPQDRFNASNNGDRFEVMSVHTTDNVGLSGLVCICERLAN